ncbi:hypothetical protein S40285_10153 [Stachybotrys chlorohalonatus IBT 40285]|uniref:Uncharacterized protein n=1 Tax=Stachybotrys chlorohalonatus (strain IBT 40285) TaxID=1283841 RepID=A0A084R183_STAC4|nr:hypothetical protein S40285_10153 [Stachybotrys chlorohalonata IBT 40285]
MQRNCWDRWVEELLHGPSTSFPIEKPPAPERASPASFLTRLPPKETLQWYTLQYSYAPRSDRLFIPPFLPLRQATSLQVHDSFPRPIVLSFAAPNLERRQTPSPSTFSPSARSPSTHLALWQFDLDLFTDGSRGRKQI